MNIVFDLDDTLYNIEPLFIKALEKTFSKIKIQPGMYRCFRKNSDALYNFSNQSKENLKKMHILRIQNTLKEYGYEISTEQALIFHRNYEFLQFNAKPSETLINLLATLNEKGYGLGIITNGDATRQMKKIKGMNLPYIPQENIIISGELGVHKPDPIIFYSMSQKLSKKANIYIGDSFQNDVLGALNSGWYPIWLNKKSEDKIKCKKSYAIINDLAHLNHFLDTFKYIR